MDEDAKVYSPLYEQISAELEREAVYKIEALGKKFKLTSSELTPYLEKFREENKESFHLDEKQVTIFNTKLIEDSTKKISDFVQSHNRLAVSEVYLRGRPEELDKFLDGFRKELNEPLINGIHYIIENSLKIEKSDTALLIETASASFDLQLNFPFYKALKLLVKGSREFENNPYGNEVLRSEFKWIRSNIFKFLDGFGLKVGLAHNIQFLTDFGELLNLYKDSRNWNFVQEFQSEVQDRLTFARRVFENLESPMGSVVKIKRGYRVISTFKTFESHAENLILASLPPLLNLPGGEWIEVTSIRAVFEKTVVLNDFRIGGNRARALTMSTNNEMKYRLSLTILESYVKSFFGVKDNQILRMIPAKVVIDGQGANLGVKLGWFKEDLLSCHYPDLVFYLTDGKIIYASITELHPHDRNEWINEELAAELDKVGDYEYYADVRQNSYISKKGDLVPVACIHLGEYKRDYTGMVYRQLKDVEPIPEANERFLKLFPQYDNNLKRSQDELKNEIMRRFGLRF